MKVGKKTIIILLLIMIMMEGVRLIMAHNKVYGHCENLCEVEVIAKENIAVINGSSVVEASATGTINIDYPTGFTADNCVPISLGIKVLDAKGFNYVGHKVDAGSLLNNAYDRNLNLKTDSIQLMVANANTSEKTVNYKIVLLKVVDDTVVEGGSNDGGLVSGGSPVNRPSYGG